MEGALLLRLDRPRAEKRWRIEEGEPSKVRDPSKKRKVVTEKKKMQAVKAAGAAPTRASSTRTPLALKQKTPKKPREPQKPPRLPKEKTIQALAAAAVSEEDVGALAVVIRKGAQLFDADEGDSGAEFIVFKREKQLLETDLGGKRRCDGAYYHEPGAEVDKSNYKEVCEWSGILEVKAWRVAFLNGDGVTGNFDPFAVVRAQNFIRHPLLDEDLEKKGGYWDEHGNTELRKNAIKAQRRLQGNLADDKKRGATTTLLLQAHSLLESVADLIYKALKMRGGGGDPIKVTPPTHTTKEILYIVERLLKIAGFEETDRTWKPIDGDAVRRIFGPNVLKSGRNALRRVKCYKPRALRLYDELHDGAACAKDSRSPYYRAAQPTEQSDALISSFADTELGPRARGSDRRLFPAWMLRNMMDDDRISTRDATESDSARPVDPRVEYFSYVNLGATMSFSIELKPKFVRPYKGTAIPVGSDFVVRFSSTVCHRGDAPSGPSLMTTS